MQAPEVKVFSSLLHPEFMMCLAETPLAVSAQVIARIKDGSGFEGMRQLMHRYEACIALSKRAHLEAVLNNPLAQRSEELEPNLMKVEWHMRLYEGMAGRPPRRGHLRYRIGQLMC